MLDIFCSEVEEKRNKLKTYLESSGFLYRHSIIKKMSLLDGMDESQNFELLQAKQYNRDDIQCWEYISS
ncbi:hypothetical protein, partial [Salmonella sp. SAL4456]|uniref:hypothetical protein n=1 Tax=Salmonella sp. SAL4456 TaxID=3159911 RepID=UPI0039783557